MRLAAICTILALFVFITPSECSEIDDWDADEFQSDFEDDVEEPQARDNRKPPGHANERMNIDTDEFEFGGDEFEGVPVNGPIKKVPLFKPKSAPKSNKKAPSSIKKEHTNDKQKQKSYVIEACLGGLIVFYIVNFFYGRSQNDKLAAGWIKSCVSLFDSQFAVVGIHSPHTKVGVSSTAAVLEPYDLLVKDSQSCFKLYASGRRHCKGIIATLDLKARQDLFSVLSALVWRAEDTLTLQIPMAEKSEKSPCVFVVCQRRQRKTMRSECKDVAKLCKDVPAKTLPRNFPAGLSVMTDCSEAVSGLLTQQVVASLAGCGARLQSIYLTDQVDPMPVHEDPRCAETYLELKFHVPAALPAKEVQRMLVLGLRCVDLVGRLRLSKMALKQALKHRQALQTASTKYRQEERQMVLEQRQMEKEKLRQEQYDALTTDEAKRRFEAREEKRNKKKQNKKRQRRQR